MPVASYARRQIGVTIVLGTGANGEAGSTTYTLPPGLRISATIEKAGGMTMGQAQVRIHGLSLSFMNKVSTLGLSPVRVRNNTVTVLAGDAQSGMATVFQGTIQEAWHDFQGPPDTALSLTAYAGLLANLKPVPPTSYQGSVDVATIMANLAGLMGMGFENNGVVGIVLSNPYFPGTARAQVLRCAQAADIEHTIDNNVLAIWPKGGSRGGLVPVISAETGMRGYPAVGGQNNLRVTTLFNPGIAYGSKIKVQSQITPACGTWRVYSMTHSLESETYGGQWFTTMEAAPLSAAAPVA